MASLSSPSGTMYGTKVEALGSAAVAQLADTRREVKAAADREDAENRAAVARERENQAAEAGCLPEGVTSAQQLREQRSSCGGVDGDAGGGDRWAARGGPGAGSRRGATVRWTVASPVDEQDC